MANYTKSNPVSGKWFKAKDYYGKGPVKAKLKTETNPVPSQFKNEDGSVKMQDVAKILIQGEKELLNISLNWYTIDGLIDAFGEDSKNWVDKVLTLETFVNNKSMIVSCLIPEGYERIEDETGKNHIVKKGGARPKLTVPGEEVPVIDLNDEPAQEEEIPF